jgi:hypothetical protein
MLLRDEIVKTVREASSGIKFTELCTKLAVKGISFDPPEIEQVIRETPELGLFEYAHELAPDMLRWKGFVYFRHDQPEEGEVG